MASSTSENFRKINDMATGSLSGKMAVSMKAAGFGGSSPAQLFTATIMASAGREFGLMASAQTGWIEIQIILFT
jgi:hypothetical protein